MAKAGEAQAFLNDLMQTLTDRGRALLRRTRGRADNTDLVELAEMLLSRRGEASGVMLAQTLLNSYAHAPREVRLEFLKALADKFGPDQQLLQSAVQAYQKKPDAAAVQALQAATEPRRQELFRRLNLAPGGTFALVRMREELLDQVKTHPELAIVDADFGHLLSSWFNRGFLELKPIRWTTPANILEKIIRYEAVHPFAGWGDLRSRLEPADRRCFGFFHPQLVDEPLIFVEVALTTQIPGAVAPLLAQDREPIAPDTATTAIFYSISNTQRGLAGVSFGHFLIKQVVEDLKREMPALKTFVTLSPVPGFAAWLKRERAKDSSLFDDKQTATLDLLDAKGWFDNPDVRAQVEEVLQPIAAHYFLHAKNPAGRPVDPVARFHLGNGARLERLNFLGDQSERGIKQAHGLMVNYLYDLGAIEKNHEAYAENGEVVASSAVRRLVKDFTPRELIPVQ
ncbi:malonyl-CoA decarboxylase [Bradyrhizobium prioriisuperbiae]|uniref:malonyl-CoA decarboxylase n=1 Tax=Bradyrhizobium prioriisuperbiae TaxID=2854389 RepID=UPI0028EDC318|nr:malonyl-CoA decarboxylase [Bradyrhizobium prioritasuperba]